MEVWVARCGKVHFSTSRLVLFCSKSSRNKPPVCFFFFCFYRSSCGRFDRCLNETGSLGAKTTKRRHSGSRAACLAFAQQGRSLGRFLIRGFFFFQKGSSCNSNWGQYSRSTADRVTSSLVEVLDKLDPTTVYPVKQGQLHFSALWNLPPTAAPLGNHLGGTSFTSLTAGGKAKGLSTESTPASCSVWASCHFGPLR